MKTIIAKKLKSKGQHMAKQHDPYRMIMEADARRRANIKRAWYELIGLAILTAVIVYIFMVVI